MASQRRSWSTLAFLAAGAAAGCSGSEASEPVDIRVRNASTVAMSDVVVHFPEEGETTGGPVEPGDAERGDVTYGDVQPGVATSYRTIAQAYRYAPVTVTIDGEERRLQPVDYVGEEPLEPGRYTYELHYENGSLGLTLVQEASTVYTPGYLVNRSDFRLKPPRSTTTLSR